MSTTQNNSPSTLVAILVAARKAGDRKLEQNARRLLEDEFGIRVYFRRESRREGGVE